MAYLKFPLFSPPVLMEHCLFPSQEMYIHLEQHPRVERWSYERYQIHLEQYPSETLEL